MQTVVPGVPPGEITVQLLEPLLLWLHEIATLWPSKVAEVLMLSSHDPLIVTLVPPEYMPVDGDTPDILGAQYVNVSEIELPPLDQLDDISRTEADT